MLTARRDQLYFDRMHIFIPIINQYRYYSWSRSDNKSECQTCLQYAMWALAATMSVQDRHSAENLYQEARQGLQDFEQRDLGGEVHVSQVQVWLLLAIYELMRIDFRRGWLSAGRALRLIQLMRLHETDVPAAMLFERDVIETEEKRRTFWIAYSLDRFISLSNGWPITLAEQMVSLRASI